MVPMIFPSACWWTTFACIRGGEVAFPQERQKRGKTAIRMKVQFKTDSFTLLFRVKRAAPSLDVFTAFPFGQQWEVVA